MVDSACDDRLSTDCHDRFITLSVHCWVRLDVREAARRAGRLAASGTRLRQLILVQHRCAEMSHSVCN